MTAAQLAPGLALGAVYVLAEDAAAVAWRVTARRELSARWAPFVLEVELEPTDDAPIVAPDGGVAWSSWGRATILVRDDGALAEAGTEDGLLPACPGVPLPPRVELVQHHVPDGADPWWTARGGAVHDAAEDGTPACGARASRSLSKPRRWDPWLRLHREAVHLSTTWAPTFRATTCKSCRASQCQGGSRHVETKG